MIFKINPVSSCELLCDNKMILKNQSALHMLILQKEAHPALNI